MDNLDSQAVLPDDPLFDSQWHLFSSGSAQVDINITGVWEDYTGKGVLVGVIEDAVQWNHPDLINNYDPLLDFNGVKNNGDVSPNGASSHATSVAGLIGAEANGDGVVGVAHEATLVSYEAEFTGSFFSAFDRAMDVVVDGNEALGIDRGADIINNSWAFTSPFSGNFNSIFTELRNMGSAIEEAAEFGRDDLGTVMLWAAGNDRNSSNGQWANGSNVTNSPHTIAVAAIDAEGDVANYSNPGANLLIAAPSSGGSLALATTTTGSGYTLGFGGTSGATPIVSGVAALMLEANPDLGYRDVQDILAHSARHTPLRDLSEPEDEPVWTVNASESWNGGGLLHSNDFGFGLVDAHAAVRLAESWDKVQVYGDQQIVGGSQSQSSVSFDQGSPTIAATIDIASSFSVEHAEVTLNLSHGRSKDLVVELVAPSGTRSVLMDGNGGNAFYPGSTFTLSSTVFRGEDSAGTWSIEISDEVAGTSGNFSGWTLTLYGKDTADSLADVFVFTDEYSDYAFADSGRLTLTDDDGGVDTLNASPVTSDSYISLGGDITLIDTVVLTVDQSIENAIGGDGNDSLLGNDGDNVLSGGRGADFILGFGGKDSLDGGAGNDQIFDGDDDDTLIGGSGDDMLHVGAGFDFVDGGEGEDTVSFTEVDGEGIALDLGFALGFSGAAKGDSYAGVEHVIGTIYADEVRGDIADNRFDGMEGGDLLQGWTGEDTLNGDAGSDTLEGGNGDDLLSGGDDGDVLDGGAGADDLSGNAGADDLSGGQDADTLSGGSGDDTLEGGEGADDLQGGDGIDTASYASATARVTVRLDLAEKNEGDAFGDSYDSIEAIVGSQFNDYLRGTGDAGQHIEGLGGDDIFLGLGGENSLYGGAGNDRFYSGNGGDLMDGGSGTDTVYYATSAVGVLVDLTSGTGHFGLAEGDRLVGVENVYGSGSNDSLSGDGGVNQLVGQSGNDVLAGRGGNDRLFGREGNDTLEGGVGGDRLEGGEGLDVASYESATHGLLVDLATTSRNNGEATGDSYFSIEGIRGSAYDDALYGDDNENTLEGLAGNDILIGRGGFNSLFGGDGDDRVYSGADADVIDGGSGNDTAFYARSNQGVSVDLLEGIGQFGFAEGDSLTAVENVYGSNHGDTLAGDNNANQLVSHDGDDSLAGRGGNDRLFGRDGDDTLEGGLGKDRLDGGDGFDLASYEEASAGVIADLQASSRNSGEAVGDSFISIEGLQGSAFGDELFGNASDNLVRGLDGDDVLHGAAGDDTLEGGFGADIFVFESGDGTDSVADFDPLADLIDLRSWGSNSFSELSVAEGEQGAEVSFNGEDKLVLVGVEAQAVDDSWALWV